MFYEGLMGLWILIGYYMLAILFILLLNKVFKLPSEVIRKTFHLICVMSVIFLLKLFTTWYMAALTALAFIAAVYPILAFAEHHPAYRRFFAQRRDGEVKMSLVLAYMMMAVLIAVFWGLLGAGWKFIIVVAEMAWGYGDAAAALVGKAFGRHVIVHPLVENKKTLEGTMAMFIVSWLAIFITVMIYASVPWYICLAVAFLIAPVCAVVELFSRKGSDTVTVPISAAVSAFALIYSYSLLRF